METLRTVWRAGVVTLLLTALVTSAVLASVSDVAELDASARATGNLKPLAVRIGDRLFAFEWPAQVTQVSANGIDGHVVVGVRISGVAFHRPLTKNDFTGEVDDLVSIVFQNAPRAEEVDVWATVPISVGKGAIVSGDLAVPTSRPVFTLSVLRGTDPSRARAFWDEDWEHAAFKQDS